MEMLKFGKFAALSLALAVAVGCSSKGGDNSGEGAIDPNAGYNAGGSGVDGSLSEEAALRAITTFYFEYDSSDLKPEAMRALDVHAKDLKGNGARVVLEGHTDERGTREYNMALGERKPFNATWFCRAFPRLSWSWFPTVKSVRLPLAATSSPGLRTVASNCVSNSSCVSAFVQ